MSAELRASKVGTFEHHLWSDKFDDLLHILARFSADMRCANEVEGLLRPKWFGSPLQYRGQLGQKGWVYVTGRAAAGHMPVVPNNCDPNSAKLSLAAQASTPSRKKRAQEQ